jgi:hypothetical protein
LISFDLFSELHSLCSRFVDSHLTTTDGDGDSDPQPKVHAVIGLDDLAKLEESYARSHQVTISALSTFDRRSQINRKS